MALNELSAAVDEAMTQDAVARDHIGELVVASMIGFDIVLFYLFWNSGRKNANT